jgi:hypothetical protein
MDFTALILRAGVAHRGANGMSLVKRDISDKKPVRASYSRQMEDLSAEGWSDYLAMRRRLCNFIIGLVVFSVVFAGVLIVLHGAGLIVLPTTVLTALVVAAFGAASQMLGKIIKSVFHRE